MYKKEKSMIHPGRLLLLGIGIAAALLGGCGEETQPVDAPVLEDAAKDTAAGQKDMGLAELTAGETNFRLCCECVLTL